MRATIDSILGGSQNSQNVDEEHDDVDVEHKSSNDVVVHAALDLVSRHALASDDHLSINDQVKTVEQDAEAAVHDVEGLAGDEEPDYHDWQHGEVDDPPHGGENLNWSVSSHGVDCQSDHNQGGGESGQNDHVLWVPSGESSHHVGLANSEQEQKDVIGWGGPAEAAHDGEHEEDAHHGADDGEGLVRKDELLGSAAGLHQDDECTGE